MDTKNILVQKKNILEKLSKRQLKEAFDLLIRLVTNAQDWHISEKLNELETNYRYFLHYQFEGVDDPQRDTIYNNIVRSLYEYTDDISDELLMQDSSNIFFEKLRHNKINKQFTIGEIQSRIRETTDSLSLIELLENTDSKRSSKRELSVKRERSGIELFTLIFTAPRADMQLEEDYISFLNNNDIPEREKCLFISALTMNLFHRFDGRKASVLMEACKNENPALNRRAIVGLIVILQMYDTRWQLYPECRFRLDALCEDEAFRKAVLSVIKQLIRSRETEEISRKLTEEIIPEMMKFNSGAGKKLNFQDLMGETDFAEKNPDWKKELEDSGLAGKLQEYSNLQMEGADVFHSTFAGLKNFSFFGEISNWFLPFDINYSEIQSLTLDNDGLSGLLKTAVLNSGHMCNSDKYSFALSMLQIPTGQRQMMISRFGEESDQIKELQKEAEAMNPKVNEDIISNQYIQDLYRFFKLYTYRNNFFDIFKLRLNFYDKKSIEPLISDYDSMMQIANYCFEKNFFAEAEAVYLRIIEYGIDNQSDIWQKLGYCRQMLNELQTALDAYLQAELLSPQNSWIIKRIAQIYKSLKDPQHSLEYYRRASQLNPDNLNIELNIGHCYLELGDYEQALNCYFKIEVLDSKTAKAWRPIAWTAFLLKRFDVAQNYYRKILDEKPNIHDYLNAGHVELCIDNKKKALEFYLKAAQRADNFEQFIKLFDEDKKGLTDMGIEPLFIPVLFDELRYKLN